MSGEWIWDAQIGQWQWTIAGEAIANTKIHNSPLMTESGSNITNKSWKKRYLS